MATLEERVAYLEGKVEEHGRALEGVREAIVHLELRMDARFEAVDRRFEAIDRRFEAIDRRFEAIERRLASLDERLSRQFVWLVGSQMTMLLAIVAALTTAFFAR